MADIVMTGKETVLYQLNIEKEVYLRSQLERWITDARKNINSICKRVAFTDLSYLCYHLLFHHGKDLIDGWQHGFLDLKVPEERFFALPRFKKDSQKYFDRVMDEAGFFCYLGGQVYLSGFKRKI